MTLLKEKISDLTIITNHLELRLDAFQADFKLWRKKYLKDTIMEETKSLESTSLSLSGL